MLNAVMLSVVMLSVVAPLNLLETNSVAYFAVASMAEKQRYIIL
jgi:hypothetical protein